VEEKTALHRDSNPSLINTETPTVCIAQIATLSTIMYNAPANIIVSELYSVVSENREGTATVPFMTWGALDGP